ncbi:MAG: hypothetical protein WBE68_09460 [Candidatus Nitrosopolaris sp.]|jgi:hypothetical protein
MYRITRTSTICVTIAAAAVALTLLTSATLTTSVYAARIHHHGHRSIEGMPTNIGGYQTYGNGNNPVGNQVNGPPVSDQANGNGNKPVGKEQIQTQQAPTIAYKLPWSNDMSISSASSSQPLCAAGICSQSSTLPDLQHKPQLQTQQHNSSAPASATQTNNVAP